jgi:hypothetical protein
MQNEKAQIIAALDRWIRQRPGLEFLQLWGCFSLPQRKPQHNPRPAPRPGTTCSY